MTYRELRDRLNGLSGQQLDSQAVISTEIESRPLAELHILAEDQINPCGEGMEPVSG